MKKILLLLIIFLSCQSFSQQYYYWQNIYNSYYTRDLKGTSNNYVYFLESSRLRRSSNMGSTWDIVASGFRAFDIDHNDIIYISGNFDIRKSTDYGNSWIQVSQLGDAATSLHASSNGYIYVGNEYGEIIISSDSGNTWRKDTVMLNEEITSIATSSNDQVFVCTEYHKLYTSTDYGRTWAIISSVTSYYPHSVAADSNMIYLGCNTSFCKSTDYGNTWENQPFQYTFADYPFVTVDRYGNLFYCNYKIYKSTDKGQSWINMGGNFSEVMGLAAFQNKIFISTNKGIHCYDPDLPIYVGKNYLPMHVGNNYQYLGTHPTPINTYYSLSSINISQSSIINGDKYFLFRGSTNFNALETNKWWRYSEIDKKLFSFENDSVRIHMNFTKAPGDTFNFYAYDLFTDWRYWPATVKADSTVLFSMPIKYKGFGVTIDSYSPSSIENRFAEDLGIFYYALGRWVSSYYVEDTYLVISALVYDSLGNPHYYSNGYKPQIQFNPVLSVSSQYFQINFSVNHNYNHDTYTYPPYQLPGLNYIENASIESYYSKGDSVITNPSQLATCLDIGKYSYVKSLDIERMKRGFIFNYRIVAKDKAIIPEISYAPSVDTGYYKCVWNSPSEVDGSKEMMSGYMLSQNYPNPFNPVTTIKYSIPFESNVIIEVSNTLGEIVRDFNEGIKQSGLYELQFDGSNLSSGVYFYSINASAVDGSHSYNAVKKMILLR